jgi:hypothetical protein
MTAPEQGSPNYIDVADLIVTFRTLRALADDFGWGTGANASVVEAMRLVSGYCYRVLDADIEALAADNDLPALERRVEAVREAWARASEATDLPQGFGWPGDLYDALEAL